MDVRPERATAASLFGMGVFQALLAAGAPWGNLSWGGKHRGTLPDRLRAVSGAAAIATPVRLASSPAARGRRMSGRARSP